MTIELEAPPCSFDLSDDQASPCVASACTADPTSETCQLYIAEFCATNSEEKGCELVRPYFQRNVGEWGTIAMHATAPGDVFATREECSCDAACGQSAVTFGDISYGVAGPQILTIGIYFSAAGRYVLCADDPIAAVDALVPPGCGMDPVLCGAGCEDPMSDSCQTALAALCADRDSGVCALLTPVFRRPLAPVERARRRRDAHRQQVLRYECPRGPAGFPSVGWVWHGSLPLCRERQQGVSPMQRHRNRGQGHAGGTGLRVRRRGFSLHGVCLHRRALF